MSSPAPGIALEIPAAWREILAPEITRPYFLQLSQCMQAQRADHEIYPPACDIFAALERTPYDKVCVLILGQDPYHDTGQAHGLCFSVPPGVPPPPSLVNIFKELSADLNVPRPQTGDLTRWAHQGVLLLNAVLTVRAHQPNSHKGIGWETFTDAIISRLNEKPQRVVFVLWGAYARKKAALIDASRHVVIESAHPSPLSARNGFFGSRPFSRINAALKASGQAEIDWRLA